MHEWALAESVVEAVKEQIRQKDNMKIERVILLFGELQEINREIFDSGLDEFLEGCSWSRDVFVYEMEQAAFLCNNCSHEWSLPPEQKLNEDVQESIHFIPEAAHAYIKCPECGSPDFQIKKGRGIKIKEIHMLEKTS